MKVGIITIVKVNNYGAELQAYATLHKLTQMGHEAELINYCYYKNWNFKDSKLSAPIIPIGAKERLMYWVKYRLINSLVENLMPLLNQHVKYRKNRFEEFHRQNSHFSRLYDSMDSLYSDAPLYDVYLTGSDQVWNPAASSSIEPYFLTFAPKNKRKISYASSFGVDKIDLVLHNKYKTWLQAYDSIAVREDSGIELVKSLSEKKAEWVLDPTLLLNKAEWLLVAKTYPNMPKHYVLIYQLIESKTLIPLAIRIGKEKNIPIYQICKRAYGNTHIDGIFNIPDAGPAEFLSLIANADFLITNSFHGTAFAINFSTPFFNILSAKKSNARMESLLGLVGLQERMICAETPIEDINIDAGVDFTSAHILLAKAKENSENYLKQALC